MKADGNWYLCGFMGAGKSTVGKLLAQLSARGWIDLDHAIESVSGKSPSDWIQDEGEAVFRQIETQVFQQVVQKKEQVVSLGGGALGAHENRAWIQATGVLVYLKASVETLQERLRTDYRNRPLLLNESGQWDEGRVTELMANREPTFETAQLTIEVDQKSPQEVADEIYKTLTAIRS